MQEDGRLPEVTAAASDQDGQRRGLPVVREATVWAHTRRRLRTACARVWSRRSWLAIALAAIVCGLLLRGLWHGPIAEWGGGLLYAVTVYALIGAIWSVRPLRLGLAALLFCVTVEVAQLTGVPAALGTHSRLWPLALGSTFSPNDLLSYLAGVVCAFGTHHALVLLTRYRGAVHTDENDCRD